MQTQNIIIRNILSGSQEKAIRLTKKEVAKSEVQPLAQPWITKASYNDSHF